MTPRQRAAERELRRQARQLLAELDAGAVDFAKARRVLLAEPGLRLLASKTRRRRGKVERLDLIGYTRPGGPRRRSYFTVRWGPRWEDTAHATLAEARLHFAAWGRLPAWHRAPVLLDECDRMAEEDLRALRSAKGSKAR